MRWQEDYGYKPEFAVPPEIANGKNKNCSIDGFKEWVDRQCFYRYCLCLREGTTETNARWLLQDNLLRTLEHGKFYTWRELGFDKKNGKVQFIVGDLLGNQPLDNRG